MSGVRTTLRRLAARVSPPGDEATVSAERTELLLRESIADLTDRIAALERRIAALEQPD